jgi:hypothetical protein
MTRKVVRADELGPPRAITDENFSAICDTSNIPEERRDEARDFLADAIQAFRASIERKEKLPARKADRLEVAQILKDLRRAESPLNRLNQRRGPAAVRALRLAGRQIASALSVSWMEGETGKIPTVGLSAIAPSSWGGMAARHLWRSLAIRSPR